MSRAIQLGSSIKDSFPMLDYDGVTRVHGETDFDILLIHDNAVSAIVPSISEIDLVGEYRVEFTPDGIGFWHMEISAGYNGDLFAFDYDVSIGSTENIYTLAQRIAGLVHENIFIDMTEYDLDGQLISARVRIFDSKDHCNLATDGGSEADGLIGTYSLQTIWEALNKYKTFKQVID